MKILEAVLLLVGGFLVVVIAIGAMGYQQPIVDASAHQSQAIHAQGSYSVVGSPTVTSQFIDKILCSNKSPACGTGNSMHSLGVQYGIDPVYALAFFQHESGYGTQGIAVQTLSLGNIRCTPGYSCIGGFRAYRNYSEGYRDWYGLISDLYIKQWHLVTVRAIIPRYAPAKDHNNEAAYIEAVESAVKNWRRAV